MTIERQAKMRRMAMDIAGRWQSNPLISAAPRGLLALRELNERALTKGLPFIRKPPAKVYGRIGNLEVRLAQGRKDIQRAQRLRYQVFATEKDRWPDGLVVTVNSPDEREPPTTERFPIKTIKKHRGAVELGTPVDPSHRYDLFASVATPDGLASESVRVDLAPAAG